MFCSSIFVNIWIHLQAKTGSHLLLICFADDFDQIIERATSVGVKKVIFNRELKCKLRQVHIKT